MIIRKLSLFILLFALTGCIDTIDSVTREYRNTTNEAIDALMMTTSEAQAKVVLLRVFKTLDDRYKLSDHRLKTVKMNRTEEALIQELVASESAQMYLTELQVNRQRYGLELTRLRNLLKRIVDEKRQELIANGQAPNVNEAELCPALTDLFVKDTYLRTLREQLEAPKLLGVMFDFPTMKVAKYAEYYKTFAKKREAFSVKKDGKPYQFNLVDELAAL